jgi:hypothetical protein
MPPNSKYAKFWDFMLKVALVLIPFGVTFTAWSTRTLLSHESRISSTETWIKDGTKTEYTALKNDILKEAAADVKFQFTESERRYEGLRTAIELSQRELIQLRAVTEATLSEIQRSQLRIEKTLETR